MSNSKLNVAVEWAAKMLTDEKFDAAIKVADCSFLSALFRHMRGIWRDNPNALTVARKNRTWGEAPYSYHEAELRFLKAALADPDIAHSFQSDYRVRRYSRYKYHLPDEIEGKARYLTASPPWAIPTEADLDAYAAYIPSERPLAEGRQKGRERQFWEANRAKPLSSSSAPFPRRPASACARWSSTRTVCR